MTTRSWEAKCRRCGRCCFEKIEFEGTVYYTDQPCEYLNLETRLCTVYRRRHELRPDCAPLTPRLLRQGLLPADCPYVAALPGYCGPQLWDDEDIP